MKKLFGLMLIVGAVGGALILSGSKEGICPDPCPGSCIEMADYCLVVKHAGAPARMNADGEVIAIPAESMRRFIGCCTEDEDTGTIHKSTAWPLVTTPIPRNCIQLMAPGNYPGISMQNVDLGHAVKLNQACCGRDDGPVTPGHWGACPSCSYNCNPAGMAIPNPAGCETFCAIQEIEP